MLAGYQRIVVLTGAGISRSAGLPTYRGPGGLWNDESLVALNTIEALRSRRTDVCEMFWKVWELRTMRSTLGIMEEIRI